MLTLCDLKVIRNEEPLLAPLNQTFEPGNCYHLRGPNGLGKTTLLRVLAGIYQDYSGQFEWRQSPLYIGHKPGLQPALTVSENMQLLLGVNGLEHSTAILDTLLLALELLPSQHLPISRLSAGQQRRVGMSLLWHPAAASRPWLLDEPFATLDTQISVELEQRIISQCLQAQLVLLTSHQSMDTLSAAACFNTFAPLAADQR